MSRKSLASDPSPGAVLSARLFLFPVLTHAHQIECLPCPIAGFGRRGKTQETLVSHLLLTPDMTLLLVFSELRKATLTLRGASGLILISITQACELTM